MQYLSILYTLSENCSAVIHFLNPEVLQNTWISKDVWLISTWCLKNSIFSIVCWRLLLCVVYRCRVCLLVWNSALKKRNSSGFRHWSSVTLLQEKSPTSWVFLRASVSRKICWPLKNKPKDFSLILLLLTDQ